MSSEIDKSRVQVTRNVTGSRKKTTVTSNLVSSEVPIMEVYKKMEQLSTTLEETEAETVSDRESNRIEWLRNRIFESNKSGVGSIINSPNRLVTSP